MREMQLKLRKRGLSVYKLALWSACMLFAVVSGVRSIYRGSMDSILTSAISLLLVSVPLGVSCFMKVEVSAPVFTFFTLYSLGPLLGAVYRLYYLTDWWDDLLHFCGGVVFAMFGFYLVKLLNRNHENTLAMAAGFALFFSIAVAGLWELFEFGSDALLHTDMQSDTVITRITSYHFEEEMGVRGSIEEIREVLVNGEPLGVEGYLDIGLIDSMRDMMIESLGALVYVACVLIDKGRHPVFVKI